MIKHRLIASLKIWIVIYPSITLFLYLFGQPMSLLPLYLRTFLLTVILVPWMVFAGLPLIERFINIRKAKKENS